MSPGTADSSAWARGVVDDNMPATLRSVLAPSVTAIVGPELKAGVIAQRPGRARFIYVASDAGPAIEWVSGRAPGKTGKPEDLYRAPSGVLPVEVAVSEQTAKAMGVHAGDTIPVENPDGVPLDVTVSGVFHASDPGDAAWRVAPTLLNPQLVDGSAAVAVVGLMASAESMPYARIAVFARGMTRTYTYEVVPSTLDGTNAKDGRHSGEGPRLGRAGIQHDGAERAGDDAARYRA